MTQSFDYDLFVIGADSMRLKLEAVQCMLVIRTAELSQFEK